MYRTSTENENCRRRGVGRLVIALGAILLYLGSAREAQAQLFGPRSLGMPFDPNRGASMGGADAGILSGGERFLRENRSRGAFVGSDRRSLEGFVGSEQAIGTGRVRAATESLTPPPDPSARINRPLPELAPGQMYYPKLVLDLETASGGGEPRSQARFTDETRRIRERLSEIAGAPVDVLHLGDRTILRGVVDSSEMARKLEIIASFEPRVQEIDNQIRVSSQ